MYRTAQPTREYTLQELAYATGVNYWTLRRWRKYRLFDAPSPPKGRSARFSDKHVRQIQAVIKYKVDRSFLSEMNRA